MKEDLITWLLAHYGREEMRPGLERIHQALGPYFPALKKCRVVTIAGTNGKGETALRLSQFLKSTSYLLWTSPHIERITERFSSESGEIPLENLTELIEESHLELQTNKISLSYYEFLFFVFCRWAIVKKPEFLILEVGLGGRLDAVNVLDAELVLLPSLSRDHQEILGHRYEQILKEKLGVLRPGATLISGLSLQYLRERVQKSATDLSAKVFHLDDLQNISGDNFSKRNLLLAHAAFLCLEGRVLSRENMQLPMIELDPLEHRGEVLQKDNNFIFFGSHNPDGVRKLIQFLHSGNYNFPRPPYALILLAFSQRNKRDLVTMFRMVKKAKLGKVVITFFDHPKALSSESAQEICSQEGLEFVDNVEPILQKMHHQNILVAGSYYFMGSFKKFLRGLS